MRLPDSIWALGVVTGSLAFLASISTAVVLLIKAVAS